MSINNFLFAQLQPFTLSGAGAITGATAIILSSMETIDGGEVTMADFGAIGYGTLEPGNGELEEQISFTGITQNTNGTATLTGVKNVLMIYPYTEASGTTKTHAGATTFVISNTSGFYNKLLAKDDDATITGKFTFPNDDVSNAGIATDTDTAVATAFVTLGQLSRQAISGASNASTTVKGIVQLPTQAQVDAKTSAGSTGALLVVTPGTQRSTLLSDYVVDTGVADAYAIAPSPVISAYAAGQQFTFKAIHTNTTTSTLAVNGLTTKTIKKLDGATNLAAGDIVNGQIITVEYDGTNFQMLNPGAGSALPVISSSSINEFVGTTDGATFSFQRPFDYQSFTTSGTWTKPTNLSGNEMVVVQTWGGGAGGGAAANASTTSGGGGGGGGFTQEWYRASDLGATVTVTIGAGGAGGTAGDNDGTAGGDTTFGSLVTGGGGLGGRKGSVATGGVGGASGPGVGTSVYAGGAGGAADLNPGARSVYGGGGGGAGSTAAAGAGGAGAAAYFGGAGGGGGAVNGAGGAGGAAKTGYGGAGGNGAANSGGAAATTLAGGGGGGGTNAGVARAGGAGFRGECRVWTFY